MTTAANIDLAFLARELELPVDQVQRTLQLLEDGNTIPFITRYRKDRTGGLNEEQILRIQQEASKLRLLAERKQTILRSIESQGRLTPDLAAKIGGARTLKWLEDVYLPYKPKKQTLATTARQRGLEPLAKEILDGDPAANDLQARGATFVSPEKGLDSVEDVLQGVGHIIAETFSERVDVRSRLRKALRRDGVLTCTRIDSAERPAAAESSETGPKSAETESAGLKEVRTSERRMAAGETAMPEPSSSGGKVQLQLDLHCDSDDRTTSAAVTEAVTGNEMQKPPPGEDPSSQTPGSMPARTAISESAISESAISVPADTAHAEAQDPESHAGGPSAPALIQDSPASGQSTAPEGSASDPIFPGAMSSEADSAVSEAAALPPMKTERAKETERAKGKPPIPVASRGAAQAGPTKKQLARERKKRLLEHAFKDYHNFREALSRLPPHRILAINRGERAKVLRVRFEYEADELIDEATQHMVPDSHVHVAFLRNCARDALQRLVMPSLERELRRELAEEAEQHALQVFIRNLRKLLLQPPVRGKRVLAVDPGFRSGCKLAAIDAFGNVLEHGMINLTGSEEQRAHARAALAAMIQRNQSELVAIGNGAGCRAAEQIVSDVIASELAGTPIAYLIVNEAGASVYSTSQVGRDELPHCDPMMRSAVSIGRRLQDPLSELVKINPANIGVGMYQHDMKAKHLRESLDSVVNLCVNFVGVELNSASPSLLGYVSGLNQLTARRVYEYRQQHGPFRNREQLKEVPGIGEATFIQAAGFLRVSDGDNPLDATWIHPESYEVARRVLDKLNIPLADLSARSPSDSRQTVPSDPSVTPVETTAAANAPVATESVPGSLSASHPLETPPTESAADDREASALATQTAQDPPPDASIESNSQAREFSEDSVGVKEGTGEDRAKVEDRAKEENNAKESGKSEESAGVGLSKADSANETSSPSAEQPAAAVPLAERLASVPVEEMARELEIGELLLRDILAALAKPGRDPRDDFSPPPFRTGIMKLEDLKPGMELQGTVLNVVDFGAFVDVGISDSALIHISKLADQYIRDPQEVVSVGDFLKVWVIEVDKERRRVSLTAMDPNAVRRPRERREGKPRRHKPQPQGNASASSGSAAQATERPATGQRPAQRPPQRAGGQRPQTRANQQRPSGKKPFVKQPYKSNAPPPKPKPVRPITNAMLTGKQPMRSFSDLVQFYAKKQEEDAETGKGEGE